MVKFRLILNKNLFFKNIKKIWNLFKKKNILFMLSK